MQTDYPFEIISKSVQSVNTEYTFLLRNIQSDIRRTVSVRSNFTKFMSESYCVGVSLSTGLLQLILSRKIAKRKKDYVLLLVYDRWIFDFVVLRHSTA